jgi:hypothetical protein
MDGGRRVFDHRRFLVDPMSDERYVCGRCRVEVRPEEADVVAYAEQIRTDGFQTGRQYMDGMRTLFHEGCVPHPSDPHWRRVPKD